MKTIFWISLFMVTACGSALEEQALEHSDEVICAAAILAYNEAQAEGLDVSPAELELVERCSR